MNTVKRDNKNNTVKHLSPSAAVGVDPSAPKDALAAELWAWLGGVGVERVCGADRSMRSHAATGARGAGGRDAGSGGGEWRGAFTNRECLGISLGGVCTSCSIMYSTSVYSSVK